jgi:predicted dehydrogenase
MKFLIAGLGSIGTRHLNNLVALGEQDILLYRTHQSMPPDTPLSNLVIETDLTAALSHQPDAVIITNPTALHLDIAIPAAEAGCHLLIEKPVSHNWSRIDQFVNIVAKNCCRVLVGYQFRFHPGLLHVKQLLSQGAIGRPLTARAHWGEYLPGWHPWQDYRQGYSALPELGGGVVLTLSHPLDYLLWMFGEVEQLHTITGKFGDLDIAVEDTAEILAKFKHGPVASIHLDYNQRPPSHTLEIIGTAGLIHWDDRDGAVHLYTHSDENSTSIQPTVFSPKSPFNQDTPFERNHLFLAEMQHFIRMAKGEAEPVCSLEDGLKTLQLALRCLESPA